MKKDIFAGIGLGLLVGIIIGLSVAEVTGIILGALASMLAAFFGLRPAKDGETGNQVIIGTFGLICTLSIFIGLYMRTHNFLSPSLKSEITEYKEASFDQDDIKKIILYKELGLLPQGYTFSKELQHETSTSLMAGGDKNIYLCSAIDNTSSLSEIKQAYDDSGGTYKEVENRLTKAIQDTSELRSTLLFFKTILCKE